MGPMRNYKMPDGTTRQYREGAQPACAVAATAKAAKETAQSRASKAKAKRARSEEAGDAQG